MKGIGNAHYLSAILLFSLAPLANAEQESLIEPIKVDGMKGFRVPVGKWTIVGDAKMDLKKKKRIVTTPGNGILHNAGKTKNILTQVEHGDVEVHIEFMVPMGSNSGVYFQGRYEIQVFDSYGVEQPQHSDCGGIYQRWVDKNGFEGHPPRTNASREPGEWQSYEVIFRAPRFDADGKKITNARFEKVVHNGVIIHENVELTGPTRSAAFKDEKAMGPLMLQGDHGPVAYRNFSIKKLQGGADSTKP